MSFVFIVEFFLDFFNSFMAQNTFPYYIYITYLQEYPRWLYLQIFQDENMFLFLTVVWIHKLNYEVYVTCFRLEFAKTIAWHFMVDKASNTSISCVKRYSLIHIQSILHETENQHNRC